MQHNGGTGGSIITAFLDALAGHGITLADPSDIRADGAWHRAQVDGDRRHSKTLSYRIFDDGRPAGFFECHKRGVSGTFTVASRPDESADERAARVAEFKQRQAERARQDAERYAQAATDAAAFLARADRPAADHAYCRRKSITPGPSIKATAGGLLLIPVYQSPGKLSGYQWITPDGAKYFQDGAQFQGAFHPIAGPDRSRLIICEGYATGYALARATGHSVACAMSAGNISAVAAKFRATAQEQGRTLVLAADNDRETFERTGRNPGVDACRASAQAGDLVIVPEFAPGDAGTDWDDAARLYGDRVILEAIDAAANPRQIAEPEPARQIAEPVEEPATPTADPVPALIPATPLRRLRTDLSSAPDDMATPAKYSELSVASEFARQLSSDLRYVAAWGRWMVFTGSRWQQDHTLRYVEHAKRMCAAVSETARADYSTFTTETQRNATIAKYGERRTIMSITELSRSDTALAATIDQWDADLWALNTPAGVVDLRTGTLRAPRVDDYCTKITRTAPATSADCPQWLRFLDTATGGDPALVAFLRRLMGYALTGAVTEHVLVFFHGPGGNGKGTFLNTMAWILGDYAQTAGMSVFTENKHEAHPTELASMMGARLVVAQETEEGKRFNESRIKALTGGDPVTARFMRQDEFTFQPQLTLVMSGNHKPSLRNVDEALRRRFRLVPFDAAIPANQRDPNLSEKLRAEAPAILRWAIDGCIEWQRTGLDAPARVMDATDDYFEAQDTLGAWVEENCETGQGLSWSRGDLYADYKRWCGAAGEFAIPQKRWCAALELRGFGVRQLNGRALCTGIRLRADRLDARSPWND
jgi:P4 family phage/plasmid primase-like protien